MRIRYFAVALMVCGSALMAGCPNGSDIGVGLGAGSGFDVIPDGTYSGNVNGMAEFWHEGELVEQDPGGGDTAATFLNGAVLKDSGQELQRGDVEDMDFGTFTASRKVYDVTIGDWAYEVSYDVIAEWGSVPMAGTEFISFSGNADGSIAMFDTLELTSTDEYDGGAWTFHVNSSGTLSPVDGSVNPPGNTSGNPSGNLSNPILDLKSGKSVNNDSTAR